MYDARVWQEIAAPIADSGSSLPHPGLCWNGVGRGADRRGGLRGTPPRGYERRCAGRRRLCFAGFLEAPRMNECVEPLLSMAQQAAQN